MKLADLLSECYTTEFDEVWEHERTATPVRAFAVRLHATRGSLREAQAILRLHQSLNEQTPAEVLN